MKRLYTYLLLFIHIHTIAAATVNLDYISETLKNFNTEGKIISVKTSEELIKVLKKYNLWKFKNGEITPVLIKKFPTDIKKLKVKTKKRVFFHTMIPMISIALNEIKEERRKLLKIINKYPNTKIYDKSYIENFDFEDKLFMSFLTRKYKTSIRKKLLKRVNVLPLSLILAQTAIESAWGTSRFTLQGNNLFGVWSFNGKGIIPKRRKKGLTHRIASYNTLLDSIRDYLLKINTIKAYQRLRNIRARTQNPISLAKGLLYYSERRWDYVKDIIKMIKRNKLYKYDNLKIKINKI